MILQINKSTNTQHDNMVNGLGIKGMGYRDWDKGIGIKGWGYSSDMSFTRGVLKHDNIDRLIYRMFEFK